MKVDRPKNKGNGIAIGASIGVALGFAMGLRNNNTSQMIALCLCMGTALGAMIDFWNRKN